MQTNAYGKLIWDRELLRRIKKASTYQCLNDPLGEIHDPIEDDPDIKPIMRALKRRAENVGMGRCHDVWGRMRQILKTEHDIVWYSPSQMNIHILFGFCGSSHFGKNRKLALQRQRFPCKIFKPRLNRGALDRDTSVQPDRAERGLSTHPSCGLGRHHLDRE